MLQVKSISKIYVGKNKREVRALDQVSLTLPDKGMIFFLGKSGSGKSTLLHMLGGLDEVSCGEILIDGRSIAEFKEKEMDAYRNTLVGFVFQSYNLLPDFSVGESIALSWELQGRTATEEEIKEVLFKVDLSGYENRRVTERIAGSLSGQGFNRKEIFVFPIRRLSHLGAKKEAFVTMKLLRSGQHMTIIRLRMAERNFRQ